MPRLQFFLVFLMVLALGCGTGQPKRYPLSGKVTVAGEDVDLGEVRFIPLDQDPNKPARARFQVVVARGAYRVETLGGLPEGEYRVEVEARRKTGRKVSVSTGLESAEVDEMVTFSPEIYAGKDSPLRLVVNSQTPGEFNIDLRAR